MPVKIIHSGMDPEMYMVKTPNMVHAKKTTLKKAKAQQRLLNAVKHGWKPGKK